MYAKQRTGGVMVVAELSANHGHSLEIAIETVKAAKAAGADAIKLQTYTPDTLTIDCSNDYFRIKDGTIWDGDTYYHLYSRAYTPWEWHKSIKEAADNLGLEFFSTPFDKTAVDFLEDLNVPRYKIASFEITDIPLISYVAAKGKPVILSTGIATLSEIDDAVEACRAVGNYKITLLKCTSAYPAPIEGANLMTMVNMRETFGIDVGLSDHTSGYSVALASVALGACMVEKHFILDRAIGGPDASFSMQPNEFKEMAESIREVESSIGSIRYNKSGDSIPGRNFARSLFIVTDMKKGDVFTAENVRSIRPGYGIPPRYLHEILGKTITKDAIRGTPLQWNLIE
jgi:pseudaminic acid synthase